MDPTTTTDGLVEQIRHRYQSGESIKRIQRETGVDPSRIYRSILTEHDRRRYGRLTESAKQYIDNHPMEPIRAVARVVGISKTSVQRYRNQSEAIYDEPLEVHFANVSHRCPIHGRVDVMPCVACAAMKNRS